MESGEKFELPCPLCGANSYTWGSLGAQGLAFTPEDASLVGKLFQVGVKLPARRCDGCGNVQLFSGSPESKGR
ncbi:hypothetical protein [Paludisphaera mucosa]|uniref:Uncharacterized protein n=1 Tax=Paludisphaera mucosa TaxID=3030827 RepID=A0ABT6FLU3_9BACT|nr:hypothetical protein [Paludisphaera mucosa]MDG3008499.1 hypothetical protein [Paludisphaera mucosa]